MYFDDGLGDVMSQGPGNGAAVSGCCIGGGMCQLNANSVEIDQLNGDNAHIALCESPPIIQCNKANGDVSGYFECERMSVLLEHSASHDITLILNRIADQPDDQRVFQVNHDGSKCFVKSSPLAKN